MAKLFEKIQVIDWIGTGTSDADTDITCDYIDVRNYRRGVVIFNSGVGTAGDDWNFTVRQANTIAGGSVKDADIVSEYFLKQAATNLLSVGTFTRSTQTADALIAGDGDSAEEVGQLVLDLDFTLLDHANDFTFLGATITLDASGGSQYVACNLVLYDARYEQATPLSAIA